MTVDDAHRLFRSLNRHGVRYVVAGGLAVVAHGHVRFTADVDLMLDLSEDNVEAFDEAIRECGYGPRAPIRVTDLADPAVRESWLRDKGLVALSFWSPRAPMTELDVLLDTPFDHATAAKGAQAFELAPGLVVKVVGLQDLLMMKRTAGRPKDALDVAALEALHTDDEA